MGEEVAPGEVATRLPGGGDPTRGRVLEPAKGRSSGVVALSWTAAERGLVVRLRG